VADRPIVHRGISLPLRGGFQKSALFSDNHSAVDIGGSLWNKRRGGGSAGVVCGPAASCATAAAGAMAQAKSASVVATKFTLKFRRRVPPVGRSRSSLTAGDASLPSEAPSRPKHTAGTKQGESGTSDASATANDSV
jgi:hypothetical protein